MATVSRPGRKLDLDRCKDALNDVTGHALTPEGYGKERFVALVSRDREEWTANRPLDASCEREESGLMLHPCNCARLALQLVGVIK